VRETKVEIVARYVKKIEKLDPDSVIYDVNLTNVLLEYHNEMKNHEEKVRLRQVPAAVRYSRGGVRS